MNTNTSFAFLAFLSLLSPCFCSSSFVMGADSQVRFYENDFISFNSVFGEDFIPPQGMLDEARDNGRALYLRVVGLNLVSGGTEEVYEWSVRGSDPSTYVAKVIPKKNVFDSFADMFLENKRLFDSLSFTSKVVLTASVVSVVAVSAWYLLPLFL